MVNFMLTITAKLVNLTNLQPQGGIDDPNFSYYFKMKCNHCGEISKKATCVNLDEIILFPTRRSFTNLVQTCKLCERVGSVKLIPGYGRPLSIECGQYEIYKPLMVFDCKGLEPVDFIFGNGWRADSMELNSTGLT
ncbi:CXXC motif containing zinc binding protein-like isoform X2 [Macadamia integrifolia]|uniref:CXXC motif containing zinc binding protein-like isoform X2 n=1 Tax=Macadamia integrifolia TaxID=60698 RepID=UPI001C5283E2|nr:CXXC motif containing zinc binding protein-like isoform X2 [Macadamia integrifolia]